MGKLENQYRPGAQMVMARESAAYLAGLRDTNDWAFRSAPIANLQSGAQDLGVGYPIHGTEDAATIAASAKSMLFGNFALYGWVRNRSLRVRRLVELYAGNGQIGILANFRAGGAVLQAEAFQYATHPSA
jgi:HK97 family phage major capsid protein